MSTITIAVVDDHPIVREGLRALLEAEPGLSVVGEAADGLAAIDLVERLHPQVLVLDLMMTGLGGLETIRQIAHRAPQVRIVVLSMYANEAYVLQALRNGAAGYVIKDVSVVTLVEAIRVVSEGNRYLCPPICERAIETYVRKDSDAGPERQDTLTSRERQVLQLAAEGRSNPEIAVRLSISPRTVEAHRANLMEKLGLHSQTELVRFAIRSGIVPLDS